MDENNNDEEIVIKSIVDSRNVSSEDGEERLGRRSERNKKKKARIADSSNKKDNKKDNNKKGKKKKQKFPDDGIKRDKQGNIVLDKNGKPKKKLKRRTKKIIALVIVLGLILVLGIVFGTYVAKEDGDIQEAVLSMAQDIVGEQDPIFVLLLGISEDISTELTDTIILCGYNPQTQKAFMLSIPRDTFVGKSEASAGGYDKINARIQKSAESTVESVELLTGVNIDYYVIVRNISITSIFECIGSVDFDVPIDMNYDDPTQDLHIHLKAGYQTLEPEQVEQLLRFRHNNDGTSYPSQYGDNDYGRMKTQREFISTVIDQLISLDNVGKLKDIASMVYTNLQTNMSGYTVLDYVPYGLKFSTSNLMSAQLPGSSALINELWFYKASSAGIKKTMGELMASLEMSDEELAKHYTEISWVSTPTSNATGNNNSATHEHTWEVLSDTSSCIEDGEQSLICSECGETKTEHVAARGHQWTSYVTSSDGTYKERKCSVCGTTDKVELKKNAYGEDNTIANTSTNTDIGTGSNEKETTCNHTWVEISRTNADCTHATVITYKCSSCEETKSEQSGSALGHSFTTGSTCDRCTEPNPNYTAPSSGDTGSGSENGSGTGEGSNPTGGTEGTGGTGDAGASGGEQPVEGASV